MIITMSDMMPVSLCLATHELFDSRRFRKNFCDYSVLRSRDSKIEEIIWPMKKELNDSEYQKKYLKGHKSVIVSNIDKILSLAAARYTKLNIKSMEVLVKEGRSMMIKVMEAEDMEDLNFLEPTFKSKIMLPIYDLFIEHQRRSDRSSGTI